MRLPNSSDHQHPHLHSHPLRMGIAYSSSASTFLSFSSDAHKRTGLLMLLPAQRMNRISVVRIILYVSQKAQNTTWIALGYRVMSSGAVPLTVAMSSFVSDNVNNRWSIVIVTRKGEKRAQIDEKQGTANEKQETNDMQIKK